MEQDLFKDLPFEIINDILLRLPFRAVAASKCVCKPWLDLLVTDEFVKSHLSRSPAALSVFQPGENSIWCTLYELKDNEIDVESSHDHRYSRLIEFDFPLKVRVLGSVNGLLFLERFKVSLESIDFDPLYVWNPISREYIELNCPQEVARHFTYGFGVSKISGQYKVVRNIHAKTGSHVYTLGTGSWRCIEAPRASFINGYCYPGSFFNGNLHWLTSDSRRNPWISCFDLETECFSMFTLPPVHGIMWSHCTLCVLRDCLCFSDSTSLSDGVVNIWLMKEYGVEKSWSKEYNVNVNSDFGRIAFQVVTPIKYFKDGDILMQWRMQLFYYSNKEKTSQEFGHGLSLDSKHVYYSMFLTPSFLSLKSFGMENVISL